MPIKFFLRDATGQLYPVTGPFRIGREPECQIQIDNNLISRIHASVWIDHDHLLLRDERSRNGTQLNGQPLAPGEAQYLHHADEVRVGDTMLTVVSDPPYPRQHTGLPGLADEPPPTFKVEKSSAAPAPPPPAAAAVAPPADQRPAVATAEAPMPYVPPPAASAPPRSNTLLLAVGGCLLLLVIAACCVVGFVLVARLAQG